MMDEKKRRLSRLLDLKQKHALKQTLAAKKIVDQLEQQEAVLRHYRDETQVSLKLAKSGMFHKKLWEHVDLLNEMQQTMMTQRHFKQQEHERLKEKFLTVMQLYKNIMK